AHGVAPAGPELLHALVSPVGARKRVTLGSDPFDLRGHVIEDPLRVLGVPGLESLSDELDAVDSHLDDQNLFDAGGRVVSGPLAKRRRAGNSRDIVRVF